MSAEIHWNTIPWSTVTKTHTPDGVSIAYVNLRKEPDLNAGVLATLRVADKVLLSARTSGDWIYLKKDIGIEGWAHQKYFDADTPPAQPYVPVTLPKEILEILVDEETRKAVVVILRALADAIGNR